MNKLTLDNILSISDIIISIFYLALLIYDWKRSVLRRDLERIIRKIKKEKEG